MNTKLVTNTVLGTLGLLAAVFLTTTIVGGVGNVEKSDRIGQLQADLVALEADLDAAEDAVDAADARTRKAALDGAYATCYYSYAMYMSGAGMDTYVASGLAISRCDEALFDLGWDGFLDEYGPITSVGGDA